MGDLKRRQINLGHPERPWATVGTPRPRTLEGVHTQIARLKIPCSAVDGADLIPPSSGKTTQYLSINSSNGLAAPRTAEQVLYLAFGMTANAKRGGFFPAGLNSKITMSGGLQPTQTWLSRQG